MTDFEVTSSSLRSTADGQIGHAADELAAAATRFAAVAPGVQAGRHFAELNGHISRGVAGVSSALAEFAEAAALFSDRVHGIADTYDANEEAQSAAARVFFNQER